MSYVKYTGLKNVGEILQKISEYAVSKGWVILDNCIDDMSIEDPKVLDGKRLAMKSADGNLFVTMREANGEKIFPNQEASQYAHGIGMICSDSYVSRPKSKKWYDQPNAPRDYKTQEIVGVGIPITPNVTYTAIINILNSPEPLIVISVCADSEMKDVSSSLWQHLASGHLQKVGDWVGGMFFSGSCSSQQMFNCFSQQGDSSYMPWAIGSYSGAIFGTQSSATTYLRADIDAAPDRNPSVRWASAGDPSNYGYTGKQLVTSLLSPTEFGTYLPKVPYYTKLQSTDKLDAGRNINTLNCITVNLPIVFYVLRDPDALMAFSPAGYAPGVYFISLKDLAPTSLYEIAYPKSGNLHQAFPMTYRRGKYGMDGFSVQQDDIQGTV